MSEVAKLYKNALIEKVINHECTYDYGITCPNDNDTCDNCGYYKVKEPDYPPFTPEKQLELIKWLVKTRPIHITFLIDKWVIEGFVRYGKRYDTFEDALSGYINNIWQDLTEQERTEIAEILRR